MFDPAKLGEEADSMIRDLNQQKGVGVEPTTQTAENQNNENTEAIAQKPEIPAKADEGVEATTTTQPNIDQQLSELKKQAEAADQRWRVLQGMIDKKDDEINSLRVLLSQMKHEETPAKQEPTQLVTQTDITEYGTDLIDLIGRKATEVVKSQLKALESQIAELRSSLQGVATNTVKTAQEAFAEKLAAKVPDWENLNVDPAFINWLNQTAPFTSHSKLDLLRQAVSQLDAKGAAEFFIAYKNEVNPQQTQQTQQTPDPSKLVAPGKSKAPATTADKVTGKRMWTRADIAKLYDDKMNGLITQKEFDELERDIFKAQRENRIAA